MGIAASTSKVIGTILQHDAMALRKRNNMMNPIITPLHNTRHHFNKEHALMELPNRRHHHRHHHKPTHQHHQELTHHHHHHHQPHHEPTH